MFGWTQNKDENALRLTCKYLYTEIFKNVKKCFWANWGISSTTDNSHNSKILQIVNFQKMYFKSQEKNVLQILVKIVL